MKRTDLRRGFTLVEMLVVIAIIAVLVAVIIPTATSATTKAKAGADAANLRSVLGLADTLLLDNSDDELLAQLSQNVPACKSVPEAKLMIVHDFPSFVDVYFVDVDKNQYYGLEYYSDVALNGKSDVPTGERTFPAGYTVIWVNLTDGEEIVVPAT